MQPKFQKINIVTWVFDGSSEYEAEVEITNYRQRDKQSYAVEENAAQVARLFAVSLPGNVVDVILDAIADEILPMLETPEKIEILKSRYEIQNRVRSALCELVQKRGYDV